MKKEYQKPEVEFVSLVAWEAIATDLTDFDDVIDGETGFESSEF